MGTLATKVLTALVALIASIFAKKTVDGSWKFVTGREVPDNPDDPDVDIKEAIVFALVSGAIIALFRMLANRETTKVVAKGSGKSQEEAAEASTD